MYFRFHAFEAESRIDRNIRLGKDIPEDLELVVLGCLAKDPEDRPQDAGELAQRLRACSGAGAWTAKDARDWWRLHQPETVRRNEEGDDSSTLETLSLRKE